MNKEVILTFTTINGFYEIFKLTNEKNEEVIYVTFIPDFSTDGGETFRFSDDFYWNFIEDETNPETEQLALDFIRIYNKELKVDQKILERYEEIGNIVDTLKELKEKYLDKDLD